MSVATSTLWKVLYVDQRNYAAQFHATSSCIKFGEGAQSPRNLRAIGRVYCVMQGSAACSYSLIWFWWCAHADSISVFGRFWSPRVISAYYSPFSKSCRFLTLINAFLSLRRKKVWDGKKFSFAFKLWILHQTWIWVPTLPLPMFVANGGEGDDNVLWQRT